jgi:hypothetical protein
MMDGQPNPGGNLATPAAAPALQHEPVSVRRRRARRGHQSGRRTGRWVVRSRNRWVRTVALCTGVLLLMAIGLYFGLAHQESAPSDGASHGSPFRGIALA